MTEWWTCLCGTGTRSTFSWVRCSWSGLLFEPRAPTCILWPNFQGSIDSAAPNRCWAFSGGNSAVCVPVSIGGHFWLLNQRYLQPLVRLNRRLETSRNWFCVLWKRHARRSYIGHPLADMFIVKWRRRGLIQLLALAIPDDQIRQSFHVYHFFFLTSSILVKLIRIIAISLIMQSLTVLIGYCTAKNSSCRHNNYLFL